MQTQINPSLQALLQTAQMVTPEQGPTVAAKVAQAAQQKMQAQAAPPGIEALMPGVQQQAMMSAQAAQPATQGDVNQLRQMMAQAQQGQGIAAGADVQMAEGGIVGYAGPEGSDVELDVTGRIKKALRDLYERTETDFMKRAGATPEMIARKLGKEPPSPQVSRPMSEAETARLQEVNAAPSGMPVAIPVQRPPAPERTAQRRPAEEVAKPVDAGIAGIAGLMGPPVPTGSERQFGEAMAAQGRIEIPQERTPQQFRKQTEDYYRSLGIDPDFAKQRMERIAAQERRDQEEAAARAALVKERGIENLISRLSRVQGPTLFSGLGAAQRGMEPIVAEQRASDERFRALMRERQREADRERAAVEDMQRALADGDIAKAEKSRDAAFAARNAKNELEAKARAQYATQLLQAETAALDRASREAEGKQIRANALELERMRRATAGMPGETERIEAQFNRLKAQDPAAAEEYLKRIERIRGLGKTDRSAMTYDQAADNVSKFLDTTAGVMEISAIRKRAKDAGQPEPSLTQIRDMLIQRELQGAGARTSAPLGGKVMTMADVQATATASGKTVDEVRKAATAAGYTIQ